MIVVDASVMVLALASPSDRGDAARAALTRDDLWFAPGHMPLEVVRTLQRSVVVGRMAEPDAVAAFAALADAAITYVPTTVPLLRTVWGVRHNVSAYDAAYLTIAAEYGIPLVTVDAWLGKAASVAMPSIPVQVL